MKSTKFGLVLVGKLIGLLAILLLIMYACPVQADTLKLGPKWVDGHSYDGQYGVNNKGDQSWGFGISYDKSWLDYRISKHQRWGVDFGGKADYYHLTITDNTDGRDNYTIRTVHSAILGVYPKVWYDLHGVRTYVAPIVGGEIASDGESAPLIGGMIGFEKELYKGIGVNIQHEELWTTKRRFDTTSVNLMYRF